MELTENHYFVVAEDDHRFLCIRDRLDGLELDIPHILVKTGACTFDESKPIEEQFKVLFDGQKYWAEKLAPDEQPSPWWKFW